VPATTQQEGSWKVRSKQQENPAKPGTGNRVFRFQHYEPHTGASVSLMAMMCFFMQLTHFKIIPAFQAVVIAGAGSAE
jgi:hypothetical protein